MPYQVKTYLCTSITDDVSTALGIVSSLVNCCCRASREAQNTFYRYSNTKIVDYYYSSAMQCWFTLPTFIDFRGCIPSKHGSFKGDQVLFTLISITILSNSLKLLWLRTSFATHTTSHSYKILFKVDNVNLKVQSWFNLTQRFIKTSTYKIVCCEWHILQDFHMQLFSGEPGNVSVPANWLLLSKV